jgi:hypothetical protein
MDAAFIKLRATAGLAPARAQQEALFRRGGTGPSGKTAAGRCRK